MKNKSLRDIGREADAALAAVNPPSRRHDASIVSGGRSHLSEDQQLMQREMSQPKTLGAVLDGVVGRSKTDPAIEALALQVINTGGTGLQLGLTQWRIVQDLVEAGIVAGMHRAGPTPR